MNDLAWGIIVAVLVAVNAITVLWLRMEARFGTEMTKCAKSALAGWQRAIELHEKDRETFVGFKKELQEKWPNQIQ